MSGRLSWLRKTLWRGLAISLCVLLLAGLIVGWLVGTEPGGRFLAGHAAGWSHERLIVSGWQGRLIGRWQAERLELRLPALHVLAEGVAVDWQSLSLRQGLLDIGRLNLRKLSIRTRASDEAAHLPASLEPPFALRIGALQLEELCVGSLAGGEDLVFRQIRARFQSQRGEHFVSALSAETPWGYVKGDGRIAQNPPFALLSHLSLVAEMDGRRAKILAEAQGTLERTRLHLQASSDSAQGLKGEAYLALQAFESLPLSEARISILGLDPAVFQANAPRASLDIQADLRSSFVSDPTRRKAPGIEDMKVSGPLTLTNRSPGLIEENALPVEALRARLDWGGGRLSLSELFLSLPGKGRVEGRLAWIPERLKKGLALGQVEADLRLADIDPARVSRQVRVMRIGGRIEARGGVESQRFGLDLAAEGVSLQAEGEQRGGVLRVKQASLRAGQSRAEAFGTLELGGDRAFTLEGRVERFDPRVFLKDSPAANLNLRVNAKGRLQPDWAGQGKLVLEPSQFAGYPLEGYAESVFAPGRLSQTNVDLAVLGNRLRLNGAVGAAGDSLQFEIDAPHLERFGAEYGGAFKGHGQLAGTLSNPFGNLEAQGQNLRAPGGWRLAGADFRARLLPGAEGHFELQADLQEFARSGRVWASSLNLKGAGSRAHHSLQLAANLPGEHKLSARAEGGFLKGQWSGSMKELALHGEFDFALEKPASLNLSAQRGSLGEARLLGRREGSGRIELLHTEWSPERLIAKGRLSGLQVGFSLDEYQRTVFKGRSLQLGAEWDVTLAEQLRGLVHVFREDGDFILQGDSPVAFGLENLDLNLALSDGRLALSALANGRRIGALNAVATLAVKGRGSETRIDMAAPMVGVLNADIPSIGWLGPLANQNLHTEGSLRGQFNITGTPDKPVSAGFIKGEKLVVALAEQGLRLDEGQLALAFDAESLKLETLHFRSPLRISPPDGRLSRPTGNGTLSGTGEIALASGKGRFALKLDRIATLQQPSQWLLVSGEAAVDSGWDGLDIRARLRSDAGFIGMSRSGAPSLSEDVKVRGRVKPPQRLRLNADVNFDFGENFILKAYGIDAWLEGQLRLRLAQGATPQATGSIRAREGVFNAYGQKLAIERGTVNFHGPVNNPGLNVLALRRGLEVEAGVEVTGTAQRPRVRLVSEPNVPEQEKLAWILFGRSSEGSAADIGVLLSSAGASLGGDGEDLGSKIASGFGVDSLSVASSTNGPRRGLQSSVANNATSGNASTASSGTGNEGNTLANQVLSVGKRLGTRTYLSFEQNFLGTESVVKLSYSLTRALSLVARAGSENALDLNYSISFR